ncbi:MAG TPA: hypothetical protein VH206_17520 [Xanthobacteraceae bacterium]|jgi:hypothetical protein|nr:hypothetical protein [Xanthobacteraceae bacterium]
MADYYPLITRAVAGLGTSTNQERRSLYERARTALVGQLRGVDPPLSEADITRERLALEDAVRKVEAEAIHKARTGPRPAPPLHATVQAVPSIARSSARALESSMGSRDVANEVDNWGTPGLPQEDSGEDIRPRRLRARLAEVASPAPALTSDGRLDAGPNPSYDVPTVDDDLATLPVRQRKIIKTILRGLPGNTPGQLRDALENYDEELAGRGTQPIVGLLKEMAEIIRADVDDPNPMGDWLAPGLKKAFKTLFENHDLLITHFPLDPERESFYSGTAIDEAKASGDALSDPFDSVARATVDIRKAGLATDDFAKIVRVLAEFAKIIGTLPNPPTVSLPATDSNIKVPNAPPVVSAKKRALLSGLGFLERTYNLVGTTTTLGSTSQGAEFIAVLQNAISALMKLIHP